MEIFKEIKEYEGHYLISNYGNVKSLKSSRILKAFKGTNGYFSVVLSKNGYTKRKEIHRLVGFTFIPNPEKKPCINHKNGIKIENKSENLEWVTYSENSIHAQRNGLTPPPPNWAKGKFGYEHNKSKEVHQYCARTLKYLRSFGSYAEGERRMKYGQGKIYWAIKNKSKTRDGYYYSIIKNTYRI